MSKASSSLRTSLDAAKAVHEGIGYPGDLAAELLPMGAIQLKPVAQPVTTNRWFWAFGTSSAVAASLVTAFILTSRNPDDSSGRQAGLVSQPSRASAGGLTAYTPIPQFYTPQFQEISGRNVGGPAQFELVPRPIDPNRALRFPSQYNAGPGNVGFASSPVLPSSAGTGYGPTVVPNFDIDSSLNFRPGTYTRP